MARRVSQVPVEVIRLPTAPRGRASQVPVEVIRLPTAPRRRVSQVIVEVIRVKIPEAHRVFPVTQLGRVTDNGGGTRIFPVDILG